MNVCFLMPLTVAYHSGPRGAKLHEPTVYHVPCAVLECSYHP